ncbi:hypothetical protein LTR85_001529 [Meristemomyces frigidus]|nr:hypothetical protein LTR85_001529 [Meristemomyces frigidus]
MQIKEKKYGFGTSPMHRFGVSAPIDIAQGALIMTQPVLLEHLTPSETMIDQQIEDWIQRINERTELQESILLTIDSAANSELPTLEDLPTLTAKSLDRIGEDPKVFQRLARTFFRFAYPFVPWKEEPRAVVRRLCTFICFLNHSCTPDAVVSWNPNTRKMVLRAVAAIDAGCEIVISYIDHMQDRTTRWRDLGFECVCDSCSSRPADISLSDHRRSQISAGLAKLRAFKPRHFFDDSSTPSLLGVDRGAIVCEAQQDETIYDVANNIPIDCEAMGLWHPGILEALEMRYVLTAAWAGGPNQRDMEAAALIVFTSKLNELSFLWQWVGPVDERCQQVYRTVKVLRGIKDKHTDERATAWKAFLVDVHRWGTA